MQCAPHQHNSRSGQYKLLAQVQDYTTFTFGHAGMHEDYIHVNTNSNKLLWVAYPKILANKWLVSEERLYWEVK